MAEAVLEGIEQEEALALLGQRDEHLRLLRDVLGLKVILRGSRISLQGAADQVDLGVRVFEQMRDKLRRGAGLSSDDIRLMLGDSLDPADPSVERAVEIVGPARKLRSRTAGQQRYVEAIRGHDLVFCIGPAGTGKTFLAVAAALERLRDGAVHRIVLVRPAVEAGEKLGFLPGDMQAKVNPYLRPLLDALRDMLDPQQVKSYQVNDVIEVAPLAFMRGRTLNKSFIILDEAQNTTIPQMQMLLTRMGEESKIVVTGDVTQVDLPPGTRSGLKDAIERLGRLEGVAVVRMGRADIVRHPLVQAVVEAYAQQGPPVNRDPGATASDGPPASQQEKA